MLSRIVLLASTDIPDRASNEGNFRTAAYECVVAYVTHSTPDCIAVVQNTAVTILTRMEQLLAMEVRFRTPAFTAALLIVS